MALPRNGRSGTVANPSGSHEHQLKGKLLSTGLGNLPQKEVLEMAKTEKGKKIVPVRPYSRKTDGKVSVKRHRRSTPN